MLSRRSFLQLASAALATPALAGFPTHQTIGQMQARYVGRADGIERWAFRSALIDSRADLQAETEYQIDVVVPDCHCADETYPLLFLGEVLVAPGSTGYGLQVAKDLGLHNEYGCVLASATTFKTEPWYGRRADGTAACDRHVLENVFALAEQQYGVGAAPDDKLFLGFSKSGFGALSMLLRNPDRLGYAGCWDVPWDLPFGHFSSGIAFGTVEQWHLYNPRIILPSYAAGISDKARVWISAGNMFTSHHAKMVNRLISNGVPYRERFALAPAHVWDAEWMAAGAEALFEMRAAP